MTPGEEQQEEDKINGMSVHQQEEEDQAVTKMKATRIKLSMNS